VTASEFAFLALGLVLGVAVGAALVEVARARPRARPEVRVTVSPNSIRSRATTLAEENQAAGPARGGPADRRWVEPEDESDDSTDPGDGDPPTGSTPVREERRQPPTATTKPDDSGSLNRTSVPTILQPMAAGPAGSVVAPFPGGGLVTASGRPAVGIPIAREADPMMAAIRASTTAGSVSGRNTQTATMTRAATAPGATKDGDDRQALTGAGGAAPAALAKPTSPRTGSRATTSVATDAGPTDGFASSPDLSPCSDQRRVADERCAVATRARDGARQAAESFRKAQRDYDDHVGQGENAAATADPRSVRTAKETAQAAFRTARAAATTRDAIETAARDWLTEINRINLATRDAHAQAEQHRTAAAELAPALERLALEADAARISAESAEEACVAAREAVASCEEAAAAAEAANHARNSTLARPNLAEPGTQVAASSAPTELGVFEDDEAMGSRAGEDAAIIRLLRGDREILPRIVARLGGDDAEEQRHWRGLLTDLVEALVARSIEAASFDFPADHQFWGAFSRAQSREIAGALASLGYRHDGFGDWADERVPSQRDLSLAVGYAGLDPMRIRQWPSETQMRELLHYVTVAADEYVWEAAGALTLGELVSLLGRRADALTDLWNDWGAVRPLLLAPG
jgi:hypothetical protein